MSDALSGAAFVDEYLIKILSDHQQAREEFESLFSEIQEGAEDAGGSVEGIDSAIVKAGFAGGIMGAVVVKALDAILDTAQKVATAIANIAINFVAQGVQAAASMNQLEIVFSQILGSEEAAIGLLRELRKEAALIGADANKFAQGVRGFLPFAEGDIDVTREMITLMEQLAVLDPTKGVLQASRVITEALTGNVLSMNRTFNISKDALNELNAEFRETGDVNAFIVGMQGVVAIAGTSKDTILALREELSGLKGRITAVIQDLQLLVGTPIEEALKRNLKVFAELLEGNLGDLRVVALQVGATLAVMLDMAVEAFTFIIEQIQLLMSLTNQWNTMVELLSNRAVEIFTKAITDIAQFFINQLNMMIEGVNRISSQLGLEKEFALIEFDAEKFSTDVRTGLEAGLDAAAAFLTPFKTMGEGLGTLFPDFDDRVQEYTDMFSDMLDTGEAGFGDMSGQSEGFQESELEKWGDYLEEIRDVFERHAQDLEKANMRHADKLEDIQRDTLNKRTDAVTKFNQKMADAERKFAQDVQDTRRDLAQDIDDINRDIARDREDILRDATENEQDIEREHADNIRDIRQELQRDLFDAVNARDARRVFELLQATSQAKSEASAERAERLSELQDGIEERLAELRRERQRNIEDAQIAFQREIADLQRNLNEKQAEIRIQLGREFEAIQLNMERRLEVEQQAHEERMAQLARQHAERLSKVARAWAEEGKLTQEGLRAILRLVNQMFGGSGTATALIQGFNDTLLNTLSATASATTTLREGTSGSAQEAREVSRQSIASGESIQMVQNPITGIWEVPQTSTSSFRGSGGSGARRLQHGFSGVVDKETPFIAGDVPEFLFAQPLSRLRRMGRSSANISDAVEGSDGGGSDDINVFVRADRNFSVEFEASLENKIAKFVGNSVTGRRRTRRG